MYLQFWIYVTVKLKLHVINIFIVTTLFSSLCELRLTEIHFNITFTLWQLNIRLQNI